MADKKTNNDIIAFLGKGTEFDGKLLLKGSVRVDGVFKGEILGTGTLIIGEGANIEADITIDNLVIFGEVKGNLEIRERVEICSTGKLFGNLRAPSFVVQEGATFDGDCRMGSKPEEIHSEGA
jgi:cytoskeletal protein CcmA (bactofilin family)